MNWTILSRVADILGVVSFLLSLGIFRKIYTKAEIQKETLYRRTRCTFNTFKSAPSKIFGMMVLLQIKFKILCKLKCLNTK